MKMAQNEQDQQEEKLKNQGYVDGLQWAEENFKEVDIPADPRLTAVLE